MRFSHQGLALLFGIMVAGTAAAQERQPDRGPVLTVRGTGKLEAKPDYARLSIQVVTTADTLEEAANAHEDRATRALELLNQLKADGLELQSSSFSVVQDRPLPSVSDRTQPPAPPKFRAITAFTVRSRNMPGLNALVSRMANSGVLEVRTVTYGVDQERQALNNARRAAVADAREQAELYADAAKVKLIEIADIDNGEAKAADAQYDMPAPRFVQIIPPAVVTFNSAVSITWKIRSRS